MAAKESNPSLRHYVLDARTATPHFPGIGRYVTGLAGALVPLLEPDERLSLLHHPAHPLRLPASTSVSPVSCASSPFGFTQQWTLPRLLAQLGAALYHSPYYLMPYHSGIPTVLTVYDLIPLLFSSQSTARARLLYRWATAAALRAARRVVVISEATRNDLLRHFAVAPGRVVTVMPAADPAFRPQPLDAVAAIRTRHKLPQEFVLYLGSNKPHKNLVRLVDAWAALAGTTPALLVIAGAWDPRYDGARRRAEALGLRESVCFLGRVPEADLPGLYTAAAAFIFPSLYEGFGLPVLEAMACGVPVACANASSLPEVAGDAALLFDPLDSPAMAQAMGQLLADAELRQELARRGLARAAGFSWTRTAQDHLAIYREEIAR